MTKLLHYLKYRWPLFVFALLSGLLVYAVFNWGGQSMQLCWYLEGLMFFCLAAVALVDAPRFVRRYGLLLQLQERLSSIPKELPLPQNGLEQQYQALLEQFVELTQRLRQQQANALSEGLSYYTLWVHQIKTPIAAMRLVLQQNQTPQAAVLQQELFKIERYAELALSYVKLNEIGTDLVIEHVDLNRLVHESVKKYGLLFVYQKLSVRIDPLAVDVISDAKWLRFLVEQILSNAVKYTKEGGVHIYMESTPSHPVLVVEDTGIGIRPEDLPRIFEKGYTGYNGRQEDRASGIGLYLARRTANALSVQIEIQSAPHQGTKVTLAFPSTDPFRFL